MVSISKEKKCQTRTAFEPGSSSVRIVSVTFEQTTLLTELQVSRDDSELEII